MGAVLDVGRARSFRFMKLFIYSDFISLPLTSGEMIGVKSFH